MLDIITFPAGKVSLIPNKNTRDDDHARYVATKHDRFHDKEARFQSHKEFLQRCLNANVIPNGLKLQLEPSIGNHNDEFLNKWYGKLEAFSCELIADVIEFCNKTIGEVTDEIKITDDQLRQNTDQHQHNEIQKAINTNQENRTRTLQQAKNRKFYALKYNYKTKPTNQQIEAEMPPSVIPSNNHFPPLQTCSMAVKKNRSTANFKDRIRRPSRANSNINIAQNNSTKSTRIQPETNKASEENTQLREQVKQLEKQLTTHRNQKSNSTWKIFATPVDNQKT